MTKILSVRLHKVQVGYNLTDKFERGNFGMI